MSRRNDVIPYVEEVVTKNGPVARPPTKCGICGSKLEKLGSGLGTIEAFPTLIALSARTLKEVAREAGYQQGSQLETSVESWRAKAK